MSEQQSHVIAYYSEQESAEYCRLEIRIIRQLAEAEVISSVQVMDEGQRYDAASLALLRRARRLHQDLGVNLEGIEIILRLEARIERLQRDLARCQDVAAASAP